MDSKTDSSFDINSGNLFLFFYKWRKPLIILSLVAAVVSAVVSLLIQNKYKSTVVMFPATTNSISKALLAENFSGKDDVLKLGEEEEAEQLLQILYSDEIRTRIIEKYDLMNHYDIDTSDQYKRTKLQKEFEDNVTFKRTKYMSVEVSVLDHNPDTAALIANDIASLLDTVKNRMRGKMAKDAFKIVKAQYNTQKAYTLMLEDSLRSLGKIGVNDYESQVDRLTEQLAIAILQDKKKAVKQLEKKLALLGEHGGAFLSLKNQLEFQADKLTFIHTKYEEAKVDAEQNLQHKFIVNNAFAAEKKSYPIRWLIVVISTFSTFLLTLIIILFLESIKTAKMKLEK